jgi:hypothetical protein
LRWTNIQREKIKILIGRKKFREERLTYRETEKVINRGCDMGGFLDQVK